jgi:hypothetical protein
LRSITYALDGGNIGNIFKPVGTISHIEPLDSRLKQPINLTSAIRLKWKGWVGLWQGQGCRMISISKSMKHFSRADYARAVFTKEADFLQARHRSYLANHP